MNLTFLFSRSEWRNHMSSTSPLSTSERVVQVCLCLVAAIAMFGGALQMYLGQPDTTPRLDNVHRFMAGVYFSTGVISLWTAMTVRRQDTLVFLLALGVLLAGVGRLVSISQVGLPEPAAVWLGYLIPELSLPVIIALAQLATNRQRARSNPPDPGAI
jgi:peptidoglycan/LPS O-acetylase OafA/YrhL